MQKLKVKQDKKPSKQVLKATKGKAPAKFAIMSKGTIQNGKC